jgi:hypothetical protein
MQLSVLRQPRFHLLMLPWNTYHSCNRQQQLYIHYSEHRYSTCSSIQRIIARLDLFSRCLYWEPSNYGWLWNSIYLYGFVQCRTATAVASFPYTATLPGTYVFTVTDSRGCPATSNTITVTPNNTNAYYG